MTSNESCFQFTVGCADKGGGVKGSSRGGWYDDDDMLWIKIGEVGNLADTKKQIDPTVQP